MCHLTSLPLAADAAPGRSWTWRKPESKSSNIINHPTICANHSQFATLRSRTVANLKSPIFILWFCILSTAVRSMSKESCPYPSPAEFLGKTIHLEKMKIQMDHLNHSNPFLSKGECQDTAEAAVRADSSSATLVAWQIGISGISCAEQWRLVRAPTALAGYYSLVGLRAWLAQLSNSFMRTMVSSVEFYSESWKHL